MPWVRKGSCIRCGQCCEDEPMPLGWGNHEDFYEDMLTNFDGELKVVDGKTFYGEDWNDPATDKCKFLLPNGSCEIYNGNLPLVCKIFPVNPLHIEDLGADPPKQYDKCTYTFEKKTQAEIDVLLTAAKIRHIWQDTYEEV